MPDKLKPLTPTRMGKLSDRQKQLVKKIKKRGMKPRVYDRSGGLSVHNPFSDAKRHAKNKKGEVTSKAQAYDTARQRRWYNKNVRGRKNKGKIKVPKKILKP